MPPESPEARQERQRRANEAFKKERSEYIGSLLETGRTPEDAERMAHVVFGSYCLPVWDLEEQFTGDERKYLRDKFLNTPTFAAVPGGETEKYLMEKIKQEHDRMFEDSPVNDSYIRFDKEVQLNQQQKEENMATNPGSNPFPSQQFQDRRDPGILNDPGKAAQAPHRPYPDMSGAKVATDPGTPDVDNLLAVMTYLNGEINRMPLNTTRMFYECIFSVLEAVVQSLKGDKPIHPDRSRKAVYAALAYLQGYPQMAHSDSFVSNIFAVAEQGVVWYLESVPPQPEGF